MTALRREAPPTGTPGPQNSYDVRLREIAADPGEWFCIGEGMTPRSAYTMASDLRLGKYAGLTVDVDLYEFRGSNVKGDGRVFARFLDGTTVEAQERTDVPA